MAPFPIGFPPGIWHRPCFFLQKDFVRMILSAEALEVLAYLKTAPGKFVSIGEICRRAGGRQRFERSPHWARGLMSSLVDSGLVESNEHGHYCLVSKAKPEPAASQTRAAAPEPGPGVVDGDYFPAPHASAIVEGDYFPGD